MSSIRKYSVTLKGHRTSISLEPLFWTLLNEIAQRDHKPLPSLISEIEEAMYRASQASNLSSQIRLYVVNDFLKREKQ